MKYPHMSETSNCENCGKVIKKFYYKKRQKHYCSNKCYGEALSLPGPKLNCKICYKEIKMKGRNPAVSRKRVCCSRECQIILYSTRKLNRVFSKMGYIHWNFNGKIYREHRLKISELFGRDLKSSEIIHHKNRIRSDNRNHNLLIMNKKDHDKLPKTGTPLKCFFCHGWIQRVRGSLNPNISEPTPDPPDTSTALSLMSYHKQKMVNELNECMKCISYDIEKIGVVI